MRNDLFTMRVNDTERAMIAAIANHLQRTQSDAVRFVIREAARQLTQQDRTPTDAAQQTGAANYAST